MKRAAGLLLMLTVAFCGFVGIALAGKVLLLGWLWLLLPLPLPPMAAQAVAIVLSLATVYTGYRLFRRWGPTSGARTAL